MKNVIVSLLTCLILINLALAQEETPDSATTIKEIIEEKQFTTLGFKGVHLGMTHEEMNDLVKSSGWGYRNVIWSTEENDPQFGPYAILKDDIYGLRREGGHLAKIGCDGPRGEGSCYWISRLYIEYFEDKVVRIYLESAGWAASKINTFVKRWGLFALKGLIKKYGKPDKTYISIEDIKIFSFDEGFLVPLYEWQKGKERIRLYITEENSEFGCVVAFENIKGIKKIEEQKKNEAKTEF